MIAACDSIIMVPDTTPLYSQLEHGRRAARKGVKYMEQEKESWRTTKDICSVSYKGPLSSEGSLSSKQAGLEAAHGNK